MMSGMGWSAAPSRQGSALLPLPVRGRGGEGADRVSVCEVRPAFAFDPMSDEPPLYLSPVPGERTCRDSGACWAGAEHNTAQELR